MLSAKFHLTPDDVASIKFNDKILVNGSYWYLNSFKIDGQNSDIYDVELLTI